MTNNEKLHIQILLSSNKIEDAIRILLTHTNNNKDSTLLNSLILQSASYKKIKQQEINNTISNEELSISYSKIRLALLEILETIPLQENNNKNPNIDISELTENENLKGSKFSILSSFVLLLTILALTFFVPCPTDAQYSVFRIVLSLAIAGLAAIIPGFFEIKYKGLFRGGGALAIFVLVYIFNPKLIGSFRTCNEPFDYTIFFESNSLKPNFVSKDLGIAKVQINNTILSEPIDKNGSVSFKNIPPSFKDKEILSELDFHGWQFESTHSTKIRFKLVDKYTRLTIEPDGSLSKIFGSIRSEDNQPIKKANIMIKDTFILSDSFGKFVLEIPLGIQQEEQKLKVFKQGFELYERAVYPALKEEIPIILKKQSQ